jgi:rhamnulokinase
MSKHVFLAMDFGAGSGRGELVTLADGKVELEELHRFDNKPVRVDGTMYWDLPFLFAETLATLKICADRGIELTAIGVDTWGVDFGLIGEDGKLLADPVQYRDSRTDGIHEYSDKIMSRAKIYELTACEPWPISSLFQLLAMQRDDSPILPLATSFLNMPDLFNYLLTGLKANERSIVSTGNLLGIDGEWSREVTEAFGLPEMWGKLVEPGTVLGPLQESVREATGLSEVPVITTSGHDTSAVVASVPASGDDWSFLSCGTWSIIGQMIDKPLTTPEALSKGFANEYSLGGWFTCRNILGLWLLQELKRKWDGGDDPWDYRKMDEEAETASCDSFINVDDKALMAPADMEETLKEQIKNSGQAVPETRGELIRSINQSLALDYAVRLEMMAELTGEKKKTLYMVGGGISNKMLCQFTANACGQPVHAGVNECTALGNALTQALAVGAIKDANEIRKIAADSFEMTIYEPQDSDKWKRRLDRYKNL